MREIHLPLIHRFETSFGATSIRRIILLTVRSGEEIGYGECTASEDPLYNSETTDTAWHILSDFAIPWLLGREIGQASDASRVLSPIRGNRMATAAIETALWDL